MMTQRNEPHREQSGDLDWLQAREMVDIAVRLGTGALAAVLLISGLSMAFNLYGFVRGMIEDPGTLSACLDRWEDAMQGQPKAAPATTPAVTETPVAPRADATPAPGAVASPPASEDVGNHASAAPPHEPSPTSNVLETASTKPTAPPSPERTWYDIFDRLLAAIHTGTVARPLGAGFVFVLILLLAKIPFAIIAAGSKLILAVSGRKWA